MKKPKVSQNQIRAYDNRPIGVFDSGLGGLTVARQLLALLPKEDIVYLGDTAHLPYGNKSKATVIKLSVQNVLYLLKSKVKLIVIACNTSSSLALDTLKKSFKVPIIGVIEPGVKKAAQLAKKARIGIVGTNATVNSNAYQKNIYKVLPQAKVYSQSCPLFVPLAEEGWLNNKITLDVAKKYLSRLKRNRIDTLILGCTHYPLLKTAIKKIMGPKVQLVDSANEVALGAKRLLNKEGIAAKRKRRGNIKFFLTDEPYRFKCVGEKFLGRRLNYVCKARIE